MTKKNNFPVWDLAPGNEMCFCCARPDCKDKMCSWISKGDPVPGWVAIGAGEAKGIHSFKILRCPQFLDSPDDPGMTREEYLQSCRGLVIGLYNNVFHYKRHFLRVDKKLVLLRAELKQLKAENASLKKTVTTQPDPPEGAAS